ncbi:MULTISPECIES: ATP-binding protein [Eubacteriales]|uniref:ATP-binding protein n=1 Tax=Bittarella massiliensis (ex Durand et al. 2017) TaxID=1720313 RepID=A0AAQ1MB64_9FIRM|nr:MULTISPECIES: ATP-binding protein [Eubacteriales]MZL68596.1 ATP-binding protein [Bittarella massiliensis (ex Durand et al. 2017)]MZL79349.1 ATP-binding protein [Bittarella massiliensis (ex Durand et al. 2017)]SHF66306.1 Histidine kinase-, DNA gyrase B-, and HSP90-like ATPase [Bittarella massiliensis (ex Durand et al. 2017)]
MLNILLLIKFITIFALTNLLYYRLEGIIISKRKRAVETTVIAVSSALTISVIGNFSLSPMIALVLIAVISVYHSLSKHKAIMKSLFCIFDIYAVLLFASSLLGAIVMTVMFFIQSDYHKVSVAVCTSVLQVILAIAVGKSNFPKAVLKPLSKRKEILSTGITAILFAMAAIVKVDHDLLAKYAEVIIMAFSILILVIATVRVREVIEAEVDKEVRRREAVHRDHKEKDILPSVAVSLVKMRMALAEYDVELAESFAPDEAEVLQLANEKAEEIRDRIINGYEPPDTGISTLNNTLKNHAAMAAKEHVLYRVVVFTRVESLLHFMKLREVVRLIGDLSRNAIRAAGAAANGHGAVEVYLGFNECGDYEICVYDNGPDFPPHILAALGELGNTTKGKDHGFGLADTVKLLDDYGGDFEVVKLEDDPEFTKCVRVTLPEKRSQKKNRGGAALTTK